MLAVEGLKLGSTGDPKQRVINLFKAADKIILINGLKRIVRAIDPRRLREIVKDDIIVRGKLTFQTRTDLFPLTVRHITTLACYEEKTEITSRSYKDSGDRQDWKSNGKLR